MVSTLALDCYRLAERTCRIFTVQQRICGILVKDGKLAPVYGFLHGLRRLLIRLKKFLIGVNLMQIYLIFFALLATSDITTAANGASGLGNNHSNCALPSHSSLVLKPSEGSQLFFLDAKVESTNFGQPLGLRITAPSSKLLQSGVRFHDILIGIRGSNMPPKKFFAVTDMATLNAAQNKILDAESQIAVCRLSQRKNDYTYLVLDVKLSRMPQK